MRNLIAIIGVAALLATAAPSTASDSCLDLCGSKGSRKHQCLLKCKHDQRQREAERRMIEQGCVKKPRESWKRPPWIWVCPTTEKGE